MGKASVDSILALLHGKTQYYLIEAVLIINRFS
jgi:hypothetical protein